MSAVISPEEEKAVLDAVLAGERWQFTKIVDAYQVRIFCTIQGMLGNRHDAEDVTQEAFLTAYRKLEQFQGRSSFYTWLHRIAYNLAIDIQRQRQRRNQKSSVDAHAVDVSDDVIGPDSVAVQSEMAAQVKLALSRLDVERRHIIVLRDMDGLDYAEIAELLEIPIGTVRSRLHRARLELKEIMTSLGLDLACELYGTKCSTGDL